MTLVIIATSIEGVEPNHWALLQDNITQDVDAENILDNGLYWVGLFQKLIHFPANRETIEFSDAVNGDDNADAGVA